MASMALAVEHHDGVEPPVSVLELLSSSSTTLDGIDLTSPATRAYIDRLITLGLDNLVEEPGLINHERSAVELELVNLCYREYPTFTSVHKCSSAVGAAFDDFAKSLDQLIDSIPALEDECRQFGRGTLTNQNVRRKAVLLQDHEDKLMGFLEIPQLMETCVRNGYYQEALELSAHVLDLRQKHQTTVMDDIAEESSNILQKMTAQLLGVLREPVKLPVLLKAVGYLRRVQDLDESQLGLVFLSSRLHNYRARLIEIEKDRAEPVRYLRRYIDLFREHVFDIISQYTTIFSNVAGDQLASFVSLCVDDLVQLVQRYIPRIASDSASMSSILVQLGYCSLSFARAGLDFSAMLVDPFKSSVLHSYDQAVSSAASLLVETLSPDSQGTTAPTNLVISAQHFQQVLIDPYSPPRQSTAHVDVQTPPPSLAQFPPLAQFLNAHLTSLNALRLLAPFQSLPALLAAQTRSIQRATMAVMDYCDQSVSTQVNGDLSRTGSRHRHSRSNSSPRAHLLRQNTETLLSAETLAAKRRETKRICVAFADAWLTASAFLHHAVCLVLEMDPREGRTDETANQLRGWIRENKEKDADDTQEVVFGANGNVPSSMVVLDEGTEVEHLASGLATAGSLRFVTDQTASSGAEAPSTSAEPLRMNSAASGGAALSPEVTHDDTRHAPSETIRPVAEADGPEVVGPAPTISAIEEGSFGPKDDEVDRSPEQPNARASENVVREAPVTPDSGVSGTSTSIIAPLAPSDHVLDTQSQTTRVALPAERSDERQQVAVPRAVAPRMEGQVAEQPGVNTMAPVVNAARVLDVTPQSPTMIAIETQEPVQRTITNTASPETQDQDKPPSEEATELPQPELEPATPGLVEAVPARSTPTVEPSPQNATADPAPTPDISEPATPGEDGEDGDEPSPEPALPGSGVAKANKKKKKKKGKK